MGHPKHEHCTALSSSRHMKYSRHSLFQEHVERREKERLTAKLFLSFPDLRQLLYNLTPVHSALSKRSGCRRNQRPPPHSKVHHVGCDKLQTNVAVIAPIEGQRDGGGRGRRRWRRKRIEDPVAAARAAAVLLRAVSQWTDLIAAPLTHLCVWSKLGE